MLEEETVDRSELLAAIGDALMQLRDGFLGIRLTGSENSDWSHLAKWLKASCDRSSVTLVHIGFHQSVGHGPLGVLQRLADGLRKEGVACDRFGAGPLGSHDDEQGRLILLGEALMTDMESWSGQRSIAVLLEGTEKAEAGTLKWLEEWLLPELANRNIKLLAIVAEHSDGVGRDVAGLSRTYRLEPFTSGEIAEHLESRFGYSAEQSEKEARSIFALSSGAPLNVYLGLSQKRANSIKLFANG